jgi:hypothetical protein
MASSVSQDNWIARNVNYWHFSLSCEVIVMQKYKIDILTDNVVLLRTDSIQCGMDESGTSVM